MKTRIVELSDSEFVPQCWVPNFLFSGYWVGVDSMYNTIIEVERQIKYCSVPSRKRAESILEGLLAKKSRERSLEV